MPDKKKPDLPFQITILVDFHGAEPYMKEHPILEDLEMVVLSSKTLATHKKKMQTVVPEILKAFKKTDKMKDERDRIYNSWKPKIELPRLTQAIRNMIIRIVEDERTPSYSENQSCYIEVFVRETDPTGKVVGNPKPRVDFFDNPVENYGDKRHKEEFHGAHFSDGTQAILYFADLQENLREIVKKQP